jgi:hypothetical protein
VWRAIVLTLLVLGSAACGAGARWERPGMTEDDRLRDEAKCAAIIAQPGGCATEGMELVTVREFDSGAFDECMRTRGYQRVSGTPPA